jgi:hypothetical protein
LELNPCQALVVVKGNTNIQRELREGVHDSLFCKREDTFPAVGENEILVNRLTNKIAKLQVEIRISF